MAHLGDPHVVRYGVPIKLRHVPTGHVLHSHNINYVTGSHQQEVTAFRERDDNDWWIVKGPSGGGKWNCRIGQPVQNHTVIRLEHILSEKNLHSHNEFKTPSSNQGEVTAFGDHGVGDNNDNWRVEVNGDSHAAPWRIDHRFRLIHVITNCALHSHHGYQTASHQQEVSAFAERDDNDFWTIDSTA